MLRKFNVITTPKSVHENSPKEICLHFNAQNLKLCAYYIHECKLFVR